MKKRLTIILLAIVAIVAVVNFIPKRPCISYKKEDILKNAEQYRKVSEYFLSDFEKYDYDRLIYSNIDKGKRTVCIVDSANSDIKYDLIVPDDIYKAYEDIKSNFRLDKKSIDCIYVDGNYVIYHVITGRASIIYSRDDTEPQYVNGGTDEDKARNNYVEKITDNLYYACWNS